MGSGSPAIKDESLSHALSQRELEVLELASSGSTNLVIGNRLGLSVHAVKFHLASAYRKLGVSNRTEAAVVFMTGQERAGRQGKG